MTVERSAGRTRELVVDGEVFRLAIDGPSYRLTWTTGPNPGCGFGGTISGRGSRAERSARLALYLTDADLVAQIRTFLSDIDPSTGRLRDEAPDR